MKVSIGVDIGGTNTCLGTVSPEGSVLTRAQFGTDAFDDGNAYVDKLSETITDLMASHEAEHGAAE